MQNYVPFTAFDFVVQGEEIFQTLPERASLNTTRISRCWSYDSWTTEIKEFFEDISLGIIIFLYFQDDMENIPEMERTEGSYYMVKLQFQKVSIPPPQRAREIPRRGSLKGGTFRRGGGWYLEDFFPGES